MPDAYLFITRTDWNEAPRARHQLANEISKSHLTFFVAKNKLGWFRLETKEISKNLTLIIPYFPFIQKIRYRIPVLNEWYQHWLYHKVKLYLQNKAINNVHLINFDASAHILKQYFNAYMYFCVDEILDFRRPFILPFYWYLKFCEQKMARYALFCSGVSPYLKQKMLHYNKNSYEIDTAVSYIPQNEFIEKERKNTTSINIGFIGFLGRRVEIAWLYLLAKHNPEWNIFIIAPKKSQQKINRFKLSNLVYAGELSGKALEPILSKVDVCIAPLKKSRFSAQYASMLNKFWIYLSFGKPVVSTNLPSSPLREPYIYHADGDYNVFQQNIIKAYQNDTISAFQLRKDFAKENTWEARKIEIFKLFNTYKPD